MFEEFAKTFQKNFGQQTSELEKFRTNITRPETGVAEPLAGRDVLKGVGNFAKTIAQETARSGGRIGLELTGTPELEADLSTTAGKIQNFIFGAEPLESLSRTIKKFPERAEETVGLPTGIGKATALPLVLGVTAADFFSGGKASKTIKFLTKMDDITKIKPILKEFNVGINEIDDIAKQIARTSDAKVIKELLTPSQAQKGVSETIKAEKGVIPKTTKTRGFVETVKKELPAITKVEGQYIPRDTDKLAVKARNLVIDNLNEAEAIAFKGTDDVAVATGSELLKKYADDISKSKSIQTKHLLEEKAANLANTMAHNLTEQGRSIQAASILGRLTPEGQLRFAAREIQRYNEVIEKSGGGLLGLKKKIPELTAEQSSSILKEMKEINVLEDGVEKAMRFQKLQNQISDLVPSPLIKKMTTLWKAGLLTGLKTSGLNIFSNIAHFGSEIIKDIPATAIDNIASLFTGKHTIGFSIKARKGLVEGFDKGKRYLKTGFDERNLGAKLDYTRVNMGKGKIAKALQKYEESVFRVIGAEDQPFYYGAKARSIADQAIAQTRNLKLKGEEATKSIKKFIESPTDEMIRYAVLDAETAVYQNRTKLGELAKGIQNLAGGAGEIVVPFGRTPSAVAMQIINYSPIGIVKAIVENIGKGRFDQRLFSQAIGRGLVGTAPLFIGASLYKKDMISLGYPQDLKTRKQWELEGRKTNSIKIGDKWRTVQSFGPGGNLLLVGGYFQEAFEESGSPTEAMLKATTGTVKSFSEQTFLQGINQAVTVITDPERSVTGYFGGLLGSAIPTIVSDVARSIDPSERRTDGIIERAKLRIPGVRQTLEPRVDVFGRDVARAGNILETMADPTRPSNVLDDSVTLEIRRLFDTGLKVTPTLLGDKNGYKALTPEQNTELWRKTGELIYSKLERLFQDPKYINAPDDIKAKGINKFVSDAKLFTRVGMVLGLTQDLKGLALKQRMTELKEGGLLTREVFNKLQTVR